MTDVCEPTKGRKPSAPRRATLPQILNAAEWTFGTRGLKGARVEEIAALCAIPKANILYYFRTKEDLYQATLARLLEIWLADADDWLAAERDPLEGMEGYIRAKMAFSRTRPEGSRLFAQELLSGGLMIQASSEKRCALMSIVMPRFFLTGRHKLMRPIDPTHFLCLLWSGTQAYADMQVQFEALLDRTTLRDSDYETGIATFMTLIRPLFVRAD
ncbi:TetR family transcriptional regulator C-terminal domain-containing protein [Asaia platycodi]|uniref:TetR family transcriptional regulator C-terminal domain-containing protein n=1 Tax=Asaia platycodi TaxID=610243 RepID=UPI000B1A0B03|nr:TetR family transcriptional regulator C-terminal domain-containing protein [Asaia platycodi]